MVFVTGSGTRAAPVLLASQMPGPALSLPVSLPVGWRSAR